MLTAQWVPIANLHSRKRYICVVDPPRLRSGYIKPL